MDIAAAEPDAPMPRRYRGESSITVVSEDVELAPAVEPTEVLAAY
jgi:hypothetical protein